MDKSNVPKKKKFSASNKEFLQEAAVLRKFFTSSNIAPSYGGLYLP